MAQTDLRLSEASPRLAQTCALGDSSSSLKFVSGKRKETIERLKLNSIEDVLTHIPFRYLDFSEQIPIALADTGKSACCMGVVHDIKVKNPKPKFSVTEITLIDESGMLVVSFFNQPWIANQIKINDIMIVLGKVEFNFGFKRMASPVFEIIGNQEEEKGTTKKKSTPKILPVYHVCEGISVAWLRRIISCALGSNGEVIDWIPNNLKSRRSLMGLSAAFRSIHFPDSLYEAGLARKRLAYDEVFLTQMAYLIRHNIECEGLSSFKHTVYGPCYERLIKALPFELTEEQQQAVSEILNDMKSDKPMNRLLMGDVGTGKTAVAACAIAATVDSGTQACVMAPTSVLAKQHATKLKPILDTAGIRSALIMGSTSKTERTKIAEELKNGDIDVVFGTTALLSHDIEFANLSLVIIDEQHRFGVNQRLHLREKGKTPDLLAMTATPIPRTLALSLYGDMQCSTIKKQPLPKKPIETKVLSLDVEHLALQTIEKELAQGHQVYVVCPVIDDKDVQGEDMVGEIVYDEANDTRRLYSAIITAERFKSIFPQAKIGLLHGRMSAHEKEEIMQAFYNKEIDILVSTTVVEVGLDVPNATVMCIYDADRFGLATLHQLRGRVGRGELDGICFLISPMGKNSPSGKRLRAMAKIQSGFELAEEDLRLRHEGELFGYRQHGGAGFKIVDLIEDADLIEQAHKDVYAILSDDPDLKDPQNAPITVEVRRRFEAYFKEVSRT